MKSLLKGLLLVLVMSWANQSLAAPNWISIYRVEDVWQDINDELKDLIADEGIVISYTSHVSDFLGRTAKDLGTKSTIYKHAQVHLFCKVDVSHRMVKKDPHIIAGCPYGIAVYTLNAEPDVVYLSYRNDQDTEVLQLLKSIVENITQDKMQ